MNKIAANNFQSAEDRYRQSRIVHWNDVAQKLDRWKSWGNYYHKRIIEVYKYLVVSDQRVLEIGCGVGDLLASLKPSCSIGVDFSKEMIKRANMRHPECTFIQCDTDEMDAITETFDVILLSDIVNDLWDVQAVFAQLPRLSHERTRIIVNTYSRLWELPLAIVARLGLAKPTLYQNWLTVEDINNLLRLVDIEVIRHWEEILFPLRIPIIVSFFNRFLVKLWPLKHFALTNFILARPKLSALRLESLPRVSVIVPARNESGNILEIMYRVPEMGSGTEIIFVEGHSTDDTYETIEKAIAQHPSRECKLFRQTGKGKGDAVQLGFAHASGEVLMILDADLTVPPEDLPRFYDALVSGKGEFINGVRLVYPMENEAMRFFNLLGNKFFSLAFSWLLGQSIKDTLCGTKVLWKKDYELIAANRSYFGNFDPFGDFDLLFGAAKLGLKIVDLPIRYRARTYGTTNIQRWKHGWLLLRMVHFAAWRIKFV